MARWAKPPEQAIPERAARYDAELHGKGDAGVRAWKKAAMDWLSANPERELPGIGNQLGVLKTAIRIMSADCAARQPWTLPQDRWQAGRKKPG